MMRIVARDGPGVRPPFGLQQFPASRASQVRRVAAIEVVISRAVTTGATSLVQILCHTEPCRTGRGSRSSAIHSNRQVRRSAEKENEDTSASPLPVLYGGSRA